MNMKSFAVRIFLCRKRVLLALVSVLVFAQFGPGVVSAAEPAAAQNSAKKTAQNAVQKNASTPAVKQNTTQAATQENLSKPALGMTVSGNLEAPKVLYVLPWKTLEQETAAPYISRIIDDVYAPIDDEEFVRAVQWHEQTNAEAPAR